MKRALIVIVSLASCLMLVSSASAFPPAVWHSGDEVAIFGHGFDEEYWTNSSIKVQNSAGDNVTLSASYVNASNVQAFLLALNMVENKSGNGTVPLQLFGIHYYTPQNREVFIGALFAFMMVFDDTYNGTGAGQNGLPNPLHENVLYVVPFGAAKAVNETYVPQVNVKAVQKLGEGHYKFGIQYLNLYAIATQSYQTLAYATGYVAKFSELTVTYELTIDNETGEVKTETEYTIGQISKLWGVILGIPFPLDPHSFNSTLGISVVHYLTVFTSKYKGTAGNSTGNTINPNIASSVDEDLLVKVGDNSERAMKIGTRGTYDLVNETSGAVLENDQEANCAIVGAGAVDTLLVAWQFGIAAGAMSIFAYALSEDIQSKYTGPADLANRSLDPTNDDGFNANSFWYAVAFPGWNGYRIVHDPVYTAYTNIAEEQQPAGGNALMGLVALLMIIAVIAVIAVVVALSIGKRRN